ncbi:MAG: TlpA family protein disulfide reductase [Burkholderiaceae bacterium]|nr:TlpA family protein disulfide reductase [Burkholderiaceae bacterium]
MTESAVTPPASPDRRRWLYVGVGAAAAAAGAVGAWRKYQPHAVADSALDGLWAMSFDTPSGGQLAMASLRGKPLLVNFWATWCPPCVEELPLLDRFHTEHSARGWQVVGLAIDQPSAVRSYLARLPLRFPVGLAGLEGTALGRSLGNETGGLPFSVVISPAGAVIERKMGQLHEPDLQRILAAI